MVAAGAATVLLAACGFGNDGDSADGDPPGTGAARIDVAEAAPPDTAAVFEVELAPPNDPDARDGDDVANDPLPGGEIEVFGAFSDSGSIDAINAALDVYEASAGVEVTYTGSIDFTFEIEAGAAAGDTPDIAIFPQPATMLDLADEGFLLPLAPDVVDAADAAWPTDLNDIFSDADGVRYGVPVTFDMKSLVWYVPDRFAEIGESVPTTLTDFGDLVDRTAAAGDTPLCVGIESGAATGWVFTDWVEDLVLREHGTAVYDEWVANRIPFDDERIVGSMQRVLDLWAGERVFAASGTIEETSFSDNGDPLVDGDCLMHRQADFFSAFFPTDIALGDASSGAVDVFMLPSDTGNPALVAATGAASFDDRPEVDAVLAHLGSAAFSDDVRRAAAESGSLRSFLSLADGHDPSLYTDIDRQIVELAAGADSYRYDASDQMPAAVGAGTFWSVGTEMVSGATTVQDGAAEIEASWPG